MMFQVAQMMGCILHILRVRAPHPHIGRSHEIGQMLAAALLMIAGTIGISPPRLGKKALLDVDLSTLEHVVQMERYPRYLWSIPILFVL
jgi:hypothetical protein